MDMLILNNWLTVQRKKGKLSRFRSRQSASRQASNRSLLPRQIVWLACFWTIFLSYPAFADTSTVTLATLNWKPYVGKEIAGGGFTTEIVRQAFKRAGYQIKISYMPWVRVLSDVENGVFHAMYPAYYSESRSQVYALSDPIASGPLVLCKRSDRPLQYHSLEDLKPYSIGVVRGYVNTADFDNAHYLNKKTVNSDKQNLLKVLTGRIDLIVIDMYTALQIIDSAIPQAKGKVDFMKPPLEVKPLYVGFSRNRAGYRKRLEAFNQALREMKNEGLVQKIYNEYGFRAYPISGKTNPEGSTSKP